MKKKKNLFLLLKIKHDWKLNVIYNSDQPV